MSRDALTPLDATFLELEEADDAAHMHIGSVMVFEPSNPPTPARLRRHVERRLGQLPRYRCRLSEPHTAALHWPSWVPAAEFDIADHVTAERLAPPGGEDQLVEWAGRYWSERLDRGRPLWHMCLLTGLEGGRWAIASKTHHALVDGVGSVDVVNLLLDAERRPPRRRPSPPEAPPEEGSGALKLLADGLRTGLYTARHPGRLRDAFLEAKAMGEVLVSDEVIAAPACSLTAEIGGEREYRVIRTDLERLKEVKRGLGGTVNDAVLAAVTAGLRELLSERGERLPSPGLRAMVPVNLRTAAQRFGLGNQVSSLFLHLPVAEPDALRRYRLLARESAHMKEGRLAAGGADLVRLSGIAPPILHSLFARSVFATRLFNLTVTNVPGPQLPLYAFGARMEEVLPLVPLAAEHSVGVAVVSYDGRVFFGLVGAGAGAKDLGVLARGIERGIAELSRLAPGHEPLPALR
ncbi:MAG: wax ester/triacylglycerol synthase family O-acyltransferase [Thermoleophilaceae bacterium]|nr:wax ester/triacylglycerol synthase family O-acyltransferase [Thermoleophilaceae bacterium]